MSQSNDDLDIPALSMDQVLFVASTMIIHLINAQIHKGEAEEDIIKKHQAYISLVVFRLCMASKHKDRLAGMLEEVVKELRNDQPSKPSVY